MIFCHYGILMILIKKLRGYNSMVEALTSDEASAEFETTREFYRGVLEAVNGRLNKLPVATRKQVQSVTFNFPEQARSSSDIAVLQVGRTLDDEAIPLVFVGTDAEQEAAFQIRREGGLIGHGFVDKSPTDLMAATLPLLPTLDTTEASATIRLP